jgi:type IV secretion system protein VirD4
VAIVLFIVVTILQDSKDYQSKQIVVTPKISTPAPAGQGQCGTAKWLDKNQYDKLFDNFVLDRSRIVFKQIEESSLNDIELELERITALEEEIREIEDKIETADESIPELENDLVLKQHDLLDEEKIINKVTNPEVYDDIKKIIRKGDFSEILPQQSGIVLGKKDLKDNNELLYYILKDVHTLILGATRAGKGRTVVMQTIGSLILAGESIMGTDPKGGVERSAMKSSGTVLLNY